jgi:hypothetical protein
MGTDKVTERKTNPTAGVILAAPWRWPPALPAEHILHSKYGNGPWHSCQERGYETVQFRRQCRE